MTGRMLIIKSKRLQSQSCLHSRVIANTQTSPIFVQKEPNAMVLQKKGETTYAEILRKVKNYPNLHDVGKKVDKIYD